MCIQFHLNCYYRIRRYMLVLKKLVRTKKNMQKRFGPKQISVGYYKIAVHTSSDSQLIVITYIVSVNWYFQDWCSRIGPPLYKSLRLSFSLQNKILLELYLFTVQRNRFFDSSILLIQQKPLNCIYLTLLNYKYFYLN